MLRHWLSEWFEARVKRGRAERPSRAKPARPTTRLFVEKLEDRWVPSTFIVNELLDTHAVNPSGLDQTGHVSLRSAIEAANYLGGNQTIQFDPNVFAVPQTIDLTLSVLDLKDVSGVISIQGPAAGVTISGNHVTEVFGVDSGVDAELTGLTISNGRGTVNGGGIYNNGTLTISNSTISGNTSVSDYPVPGLGVYYGLGGGIFNGGSLTLNNCIISGNTAQWDGAGICNSGGATVQLTNSIVSGNAVTPNPYNGYQGIGGGICNLGNAELTDCTISDNSSSNGGGICDSGTATILKSTLSGNYAQNGGGLCGGAATSLVDSTVSGNVATFGGGIVSSIGNTYYPGGGGVTCSDCTISGNSAVHSGGIDVFYGSVTLNNTIVADNTSKAGNGDVTGTVSSASLNNLIGDGGGIKSGISNGINGNHVGSAAAPINPLLAPLGNYGGPTQTMALLPGSPAINAGSFAALPPGLTTDQRGLPRIVNGTVDVGAFESGSDLAPIITSVGNATLVVGQTGSYTVAASSFPVAVLSETGSLPAGVTFTDNGNGTATIAGPPAAGTASLTPYSFTIQASNGVGASATQVFALTINQASSITSAGSATLVVGQSGSFTVTTTGFPSAVVSEIGTLPAGLTWTDNGNGTASISGTPLAGSARAKPYRLTIQASNGVGTTVTQTFQLTIDQAPVITSTGTATFVVGKAGSFSVKVTPGVPTATKFSETGSLPKGITFSSGVLSGTPAVGTAGTYHFTINANNGLSVTQSFTLTVKQSPAITSVNSATLVVGQASSFKVTTTGFPLAILSEIGTLPAGLTFTDNGNGTATLSGTPLPGSAKPTPYTFTIEASNGVGAIVKQTFKLLISS